MGSVTLKELCRVTLVHKEFPDGVDGLFEMGPTEIGQKTLTSYKLNFKKVKDGFAVIAPYENDGTGDKLLWPFLDNAKLAFTVYAKDPNFFDYSDLPYDPPGDYVYYFNNLDASSRRTSLLNGNAGIAETEKVKLHTKQFSFSILESETGNISVYDCRGQLIPATDYDHEYDSIKNVYNIDLSRKEDGLYTIDNDGTTTDYYCVKASFIRTIPLLIVEFFVDSSVPVDFQLVNRDGDVQYMDPKSFTLHFGVFDAYWRYKIIPVNIPHYLWIKVLANDSNYDFTPNRVRITSEDPITFTIDPAVDFNNQSLIASLYKAVWDEDCYWSSWPWPPSYYYCDHNYGIWVDGQFVCRHPNTQGEYVYPCPATSEDFLIQALPRPNEVATDYYMENDKYYAEITLYLHQQGSSYYLSESETG